MNRKESLGEVHSSVNTQGKSKFKKLLSYLGPAYLVSVGYMDPGNWATDIAGGSGYGYSLLWVLLMSNLMALLLQSLSARLGIVKGLDLAQASNKAYPKFANLCLYLLAQIAIVACDLAEVIGMAIGLQLLFGVPLLYGICISVLDTLLLLYLLNKGIRSLEAFIVSMVSVIGVSFLVEMFIVKPQAVEVLEGFAPSSLSGGALYIAIGIIGATVMPHNLYLHSSLVQTRKLDRDKKGILEALKFNFIDTAVALNLAFLVNAAILILAAAAFHHNGYFQVAEIQDAYRLLNNIFGKAAPILFAIALIASGQSSTITGTLAGQIIMEGHINLRIQPWLRRLITRLLAILPAVMTIVFFGENKMGQLLVLSQVILSLQLGFAVVPLVIFTSSKKYLGEFAIKPWVSLVAWLGSGVILFLNMRLVAQELNAWFEDCGGAWWIYLIYAFVLGLVFLLVYIIVKPLSIAGQKRKWVHEIHLPIEYLSIKSYENIAISVDFSDSDNSAIQHALLQGGKDAKYMLIHVVETAGARYYGDDVFDYETQEDTQNLIKYQQELERRGYKVSYILGYGNAADAIVNVVVNSQTDILVMATHGHRTFKDILYGTTVEAVRHRVDVPVLLV